MLCIDWVDECFWVNEFIGLDFKYYKVVLIFDEDDVEFVMGFMGIKLEFLFIVIVVEE